VEVTGLEPREPLSVACSCRNRGMARIRVSTTVDGAPLAIARELCRRPRDAALLDQTLAAIITCHRLAVIDVAHEAYDVHPIDQPDEWGDLGSFRNASATTRRADRFEVKSGGANFPASAVGRSSFFPGMPQFTE
jgi:hypothetical protein